MLTHHLIDESYHVCHKGYLSLFPLILGLLPPDSPHLGPVLDLMHDPEHLWSPYGLRSLSLSHPEFGKGENYWKGPIWIQMNFLALKSMYKVCLTVGDHNIMFSSRPFCLDLRCPRGSPPGTLPRYLRRSEA